MSAPSQIAVSEDTPGTTPTPVRSLSYSILIGLAALGVLLQGVWAALFIHEGQDNNSTWVEVHARGADVTLVLAVLATGVALARLRSRRDLVIGSVVFTLALALEAFLGGLVGDHSTLEVVHFPLAMALLGLAVWLPMRARAPRPAAAAVR